MSCNILAGGSVRKYRHYVTEGWKQVLPMRSKRENLNNLAKLLSDFDIVGLQEADAGSLRSGFLNQTEYLAEAAGFPYWSHQPNRKIAQFAASSNGLLTRIRPVEVLDYPLPGRIPGRGALWIRFGSDVAGRREAVREWFRARGRQQFTWWIGSSATPMRRRRWNSPYPARYSRSSRTSPLLSQARACR